MKTALETAVRHGAKFTSNGQVTMNQHELMSAFQEYASQAIDEAAKRAEVKDKMLDACGYPMKFSVDRESILSIKSELK